MLSFDSASNGTYFWDRRKVSQRSPIETDPLNFFGADKKISLVQVDIERARVLQRFNLHTTFIQQVK